MNFEKLRSMKNQQNLKNYEIRKIVKLKKL